MKPVSEISIKNGFNLLKYHCLPSLPPRKEKWTKRNYEMKVCRIFAILCNPNGIFEFLKICKFSKRFILSITIFSLAEALRNMICKGKCR